MTCVDFCDSQIEREFRILCDEMYWDGGFSLKECLNLMNRMAKKLNVVLSDVEEFDGDKFFYDWYRNTEKGLS